MHPSTSGIQNRPVGGLRTSRPTAGQPTSKRVVVSRGPAAAREKPQQHADEPATISTLCYDRWRSDGASDAGCVEGVTLRKTPAESFIRNGRWSNRHIERRSDRPWEGPRPRTSFRRRAGGPVENTDGGLVRNLRRNPRRHAAGIQGEHEEIQ